VAASILCLQLAWNDFLFSAVLTNNATRTLPVLMAAFSGGDTGVDWGGMTASGVLVILPVIVFSFLAQRHLVAGCRRERSRDETSTHLLAGTAATLAMPALAQSKPDKLVYVGDNGPWHWVLVEEVAPAFEKPPASRSISRCCRSIPGTRG
jgi:hypothetical protein